MFGKRKVKDMKEFIDSTHDWGLRLSLANRKEVEVMDRGSIESIKKCIGDGKDVCTTCKFFWVDGVAPVRLHCRKNPPPHPTVEAGWWCGCWERCADLYVINEQIEESLKNVEAYSEFSESLKTAKIVKVQEGTSNYQNTKGK